MKLLTLELPKGEFDVETSLICPTKCWRCDHSNESSRRVHYTCAVCAITGEFIFLHFSFGQTNIAVRVNVKRGRLYYFSNNSKHGSCQSISIPPSLEGSLWTFHLFQPANPSCRKLSDSFKPIQATDARDQFVCSANQHPKSTIKKEAHKPLRTSWISPKMCLPRLIIMQLVIVTVE